MGGRPPARPRTDPTDPQRRLTPESGLLAAPDTQIKPFVYRTPQHNERGSEEPGRPLAPQERRMPDGTPPPLLIASLSAGPKTEEHHSVD